MEVEFWATTDEGRVRDHNEDNFLVDGDLKLFVVCDGMGGHAAGEVASAMSVQTIHQEIDGRREVVERLAREPANPQHRQAVLALLEEAITAASNRVFAAAQQDSERTGMGTTCSALLLCGGRAFIGHVGDSRIYRVRAGEVEQLTDDHSLINEMIRQGRAKAGDSIPNQNAVTRAVGVREVVEVDTLDIPVDTDDEFLLCSDGLSGYFDDDAQIVELMAGDDLEARAEACIAHALDGGGKDNITAIVLAVAGVGAGGEGRLNSRLVDRLSATPFFAHASRRELVLLAEIADRRDFEAGETIVDRGQPADAMCVITKGSVGVLGADSGVIVLDAGATFGVLEIFAEQVADEAFEALEPVSLVVLRKKPLFELLRTLPELAAKVLFGVARRFASQLRRVPSELRYEPTRWDEVHLQSDVTPAPGSMVIKDDLLDQAAVEASQGRKKPAAALASGPVEPAEQAPAKEEADPAELRKTVKLDLNDAHSDES
ncbi:MAG: protein phosphatase 2C domain-containing protein [Persicimonas sp.]